VVEPLFQSRMVCLQGPSKRLFKKKVE